MKIRKLKELITNYTYTNDTTSCLYSKFLYAITQNGIQIFIL